MTPLLVSHLLAALIALPLGGYQLFRPTKGVPATSCSAASGSP